MGTVPIFSFSLLVFAILLTVSAAEARQEKVPAAGFDALVDPAAKGVRAVPATLTGNRRPVDEARRADLNAWFAKDKRGPDMALLLDTELEVEDGGRRAWVPASAAAEAVHRGKAGDPVTLVVETIAGASGRRFAIAPRIEWGRIHSALELPADEPTLTEVMRLRYARGLLGQVRQCAAAKRGPAGFPATLDDATPARCIPPGLLKRPVFGYRFLYEAGPPGPDGAARLFFACAIPGTRGQNSSEMAADEEGDFPPMGMGGTGRVANCMLALAQAGGGFALRAVKNCLVLHAAAQRARGGANAYPPDLTTIAAAGCEAPVFKVLGPNEVEVKEQRVAYTPKSTGSPARVAGFSLDAEWQYATGTFLHLDESGLVRIALARPAGPKDRTQEEEIAQQGADAERAKAEYPADRAKCEKGDLAACNAAAAKAWIARESQHSFPLWERACAGGDREGCVMAKSKPYGARQFDRVLYTRTACFRGDAEACGKIPAAVAAARLPAVPGD